MYKIVDNWEEIKVQYLVTRVEFYTNICDRRLLWSWWLVFFFVDDRYVVCGVF